MNKIYADHAATTKLSDRALNAMLPYMRDSFYNPSTLYSSAREPRKAIRLAREEIAEIIGALPEEIYFTSGGTEADNWAIKNVIFSSDNKNKIITSAIEHHAILNSCKILEKLGYQITYLPVDGQGLIDANYLSSAIDDKTALVSIMMVNNEIGTIQNIKELADVTSQKGVLFHTDAVQAVGHIDVNVNDMGVDLLSASAHKFNGPKGVGFLYVRSGIGLSPYITGGEQEQGKRAGTENVAGIVGMAEALKENTDSLHDNQSHLRELVTKFIEGLKNSNVDFIINGSQSKVPGNISVSFADIDGEMILHRLDLKGIEIATGSACDSQNTQISHVIQAIGVPEKYAKGTIRVSLGIENTLDEIDTIVKELIGVVRK
jgi:cysteine desulfurase